MGVGEALDGHTEGELSAVTVAVQVAAVMRVQSLAQEFPHAVGAVGKKKKRQCGEEARATPGSTKALVPLHPHGHRCHHHAQEKG